MPRIRISEDTIPDRIRSLSTWSCWRKASEKGGETAVPVKAYDTGGSSIVPLDDPEMWSDFTTALTYHRKGKEPTDGVAFIFSSIHPIVGVALPDCRALDTGEIASGAQDIIAQLDSYTEVSPWGTDIHVLVTGKLPDDQVCTDTIELYAARGFLPITGAPVDGAPQEINPRPDVLSQVHSDYSLSMSESNPGPAADGSKGPPPTGEGGLPVEQEVYPADLCSPDVDRWLTWKEDEDGEKIPRAPHVHSSFPDKFADSQDSSLWTDFETAHEWADKLPGHDLAFVIRNRNEYSDEDLVLIDYDDVRDPETKVIHPTVRDHLAAADSYADLSPSGTGIHLLCRGTLPDDLTAFDGSLPADERFPDASIEVYASARFVTMTGRHLVSTPKATRPAETFLDRLTAVYVSTNESSTDDSRDSPADTSEPSSVDDSDDSLDLSKAELRALETTPNMKVIYHAIDKTEPGDIWLDSPVTEERSDGTKSRDPDWAQSESGTRLAELEDGWVYRKGMIGLDALQVVALEEDIITDEHTYPSGNAFWEALRALRARGAPIPQHAPRFDGSSSSSGDDSGVSNSGVDTDAGRPATPDVDASQSGDADSGGKSATESAGAAADPSPGSSSSSSSPDGSVASNGGSDDSASPADAEAGGDVGAGASSSTDGESAEGRSADGASPEGESATGQSPEEESPNGESKNGDPAEEELPATGEAVESPEPVASSDTESEELLDLTEGAPGDEADLSPAEAKAQFREQIHPDSGLREEYGREYPEIEDWPLEIALHELPARKLPQSLPQSLDEASGPGHDLADEAVLNRAFDSDPGEDIERLYEGDPGMWEGVDSEYKNEQTAASALLFHLAFWTAGDLDQMERLFRQSELLDETWDRFLYPPNVTFGEVALAKAVAAVNEYYTRANESEPEHEPWGQGSGASEPPARANPAALRGTAGGLDVEAAFEAAQAVAMRAQRYEYQFHECEQQLSDCRELVRELWERLRLYREAVGVEPERKHGLDPETLRAAGVNAVTEDGPAGRPPPPPGQSSPRKAAGNAGGVGSHSAAGGATHGDSVGRTDESTVAGAEPWESFVPDRTDADAGVGDLPAEAAPSDGDEEESGFFSRFF